MQIKDLKKIPNKYHQEILNAQNEVISIFRKNGKLDTYIFYAIFEDKKVEIYQVEQDFTKYPKEVLWKVLADLFRKRKPLILIKAIEAWTIDQDDLGRYFNLDPKTQMTEILERAQEVYKKVKSIEEVPGRAEAISLAIDSVWGPALKNIIIRRNGEKIDLDHKDWFVEGQISGLLTNWLTEPLEMN